MEFDQPILHTNVLKMCNKTAKLQNTIEVKLSSYRNAFEVPMRSKHF